MRASDVVRQDLELWLGIDRGVPREQEVVIGLDRVRLLGIFSYDDLAAEDAARLAGEDALVQLLAIAVRPGVVDHRVSVGVLTTADQEKAVEGAFGADIDYAMLIKIYGAAPESAKGRYSPAECTGARKRRIEGDPDPRHVSTSYIERSNLTVRMHVRRFTRLTNAFSKKVENHAYAVALHVMYYNFVRIHSTLRMSPAMAAGVTNRLWEISDIVKLVEHAEREPGKRGPYKKRNSN